MDKEGAVPHGNFVGNGGQAYEIEGKLIPRDLFELALHKAPYFGTEIDSNLAKLAGTLDLPSELPYDRELFLMKLTDLDKVIAGLGECILKALLQYSWLVSKTPLPRTDEGDNVLNVDTLAPIVQIVNRIQNNLHIHRPSWARLSDQYRIAMMIHEGVYSLLKVTQINTVDFLQHGPIARKIAGSFFDKKVIHQSGTSATYIKNELEIIFQPEVKSVETQFYSYRTSAGAIQFAVRAKVPARA